MSKKQQIESSNTPELTPIEEKLLDCAKNGIPVLLYGKDAIGRKELVLKIHMLNGGIDSDVEYFNDRGEFVPREEYTKSVWIAFTNKHKLKLPHSRSTQRTWDYINCAGMTPREVYHELVEESTRIKREFDDYEATAFERELQSIGIMNSKSHTPGALFVSNGMLFLDNLTIYNDNSIYYDKLAGILKNKVTAFVWLVVCANNPEGFPLYFREQFQEISLEPKCSLNSLKDIYLGYYNYITSTIPFVLPGDRHSNNTYFSGIKEYTERLPSELLFHIKDDNGETVLVNDRCNAEKLWRDALGIGERQYSFTSDNTNTPPPKPDEPIVWGDNWMSKVCQRKHDFEVSRVKSYLRVEHERHLEKLEPKTESIPEKQEPAKGQGIKVSFNKTDYIVTINGKEYLFEEEDKKSKKRRKLFNEYKLFELLHSNRDRYVNIGEIKKELGIRKEMETNQIVYNKKYILGVIIKESPYKIETQNGYEGRGGYKLTLKQQD